MSVNKETLRLIAEENLLDITEVSPLAGGDINEVFLITTSLAEKFVLKLNDAQKLAGMFQAEKAGLEALSLAGNFTVPQVINCGESNGESYLLLEFLESSPPSEEFSEIFGHKLASLHRNTSDEFGFKTNNYIGSLPQQNNFCKTASQFYITQRLEPQLKLARDAGYKLGDPNSLFKTCEQIIPAEPPALIHGDLWSGNYLIDPNGLPCLIDPAVAFAPREMDLAMMKLFGGFDSQIFLSYNEHFPLEKEFEKRIALWQLYYLLVHLNIFGTGYEARVKSILKKYS